MSGTAVSGTVVSAAGTERHPETSDDPVGEAADLVRRAELDVGAASLAAEAGDHDIAYALLLDAVDGWRFAHDLLVDVVEHVGEAPEAGPIGVAPEPAAPEPAAPDPVGPPPPVAERHEAAPPDVEQPTEPLPHPHAAPAASAPSAATGGEADETPGHHGREPRRGRFERARRRRSPRRGSASRDAAPTVEASVRIAPVVAPEGTEDEYQAWADRLRERRAELKEAAGEIDLTVVRRAHAEHDHGGRERGPTPSAS